MNDELKFILKVRDEASAALKAAGNAVRGLGQQASVGAKGLAEYAAQQVNVARTAQSGIGSLTNFAAAMAAAYGAMRSVSAAGQFDRSMTQITSLVGESTQQVALWRKELLATSVQFGRTPQEMAAGLYNITSSGISAANAMDVLKASAMASAAGLGSVDVISDAATSALNAYGQENLNAADAIGQMLVGIREGKVEADKLAASLGQAIPTAAQAGVEFHEVNAALAAMSLTGIDAARGATIVRQTLQDVIAPSAQAVKQLEAVGSSAKEMQAVFRDQGYLKGLEFLREKLGTGLEFRKVVNDAEALSGMLALTGENAEKVHEIFDALSKATGGDLKTAFEVAAQSGAFKLDQGIALLQSGLIALGDMVMPMVISAVNQLIQVWDYFFADTLEANNRLMILSAVVKTLAIGFGLWGAAIIALKLSAFLGMIGNAVIVVYGLATGMTGLSTATLVASGAMSAFRVALLSTGIGAIVVLLGTLIAAMVYFGSKTYEVAGTVASGWQVIVGAFRAAYAFVASILSDLVSLVTDNMGAITAVLAVVPATWPVLIYAYWDEIVAATEEAWNSVTSFVSDNITQIVAAIPLVGPSVAWIVENWDWMKDSLVGAWNAVYDGTRAVINKLIDLIPGLRSVINYVIELGNRMAAAYDRATAAASGAFKESVQGKATWNPNAPKGGIVAWDGAPIGTRARAKAGLNANGTPAAPEFSGGGGGAGGKKGGGGGGAKADPYGDAVKDQKERIETAKAEITLEQELANVVAESARARAVATEELKSYAAEATRIRKLQADGKLTEAQAKSLLVSAKAYAQARGELAGVKYDGDQAEKNREAADSLRVLQSQTVKYVEAAKLDKQARIERIAYLDAETAALARGASAEQAAIEGTSAAARKHEEVTRDLATTQEDMMRSAQEQLEYLQAMAEAHGMTADEAAIHEAYVRALAEAQRAGIPDAEAYAQAMAEVKRQQIALEQIPETAGQGFRRWMEDMKKQALDSGQFVYNTLGTVFDGLTNAMTRALTGQKVGWRSLLREMASGIAAMIAKAMVWMALTKLIALIPGGSAILAAMDQSARVMTAIGAAAQGAKVAGLASSAAKASSKNADGNVFSNGIVRGPTYFSYGKGQKGLMGEAGPEGIFPLTNGGTALYAFVNGQMIPLPIGRGPNNKLGVNLNGRFANGGLPGRAERTSGLPRLARIPGMSGGGSGAPQDNSTHISFGDTHIEFVGSGNAEQDRESAEQLTKMFDATIDDKIGRAMRRMTKDGGALNLGLGKGG